MDTGPPLDYDWCRATTKLQWRKAHGLLCYDCRRELEDTIAAARARREAAGEQRRREEQDRQRRNE